MDRCLDNDRWVGLLNTSQENNLAVEPKIPDASGLVDVYDYVYPELVRQNDAVVMAVHDTNPFRITFSESVRDKMEECVNSVIHMVDSHPWINENRKWLAWDEEYLTAYDIRKE